MIGPNIKKTHCIDGSIIEELFYKNGFRYTEKPTRKECGCTDSTDIGDYDTCTYGCIYCYANINKKRAYRVFENHDAESAFLDHSKRESDKWIEDIELSKKNNHIEKTLYINNCRYLGDNCLPIFNKEMVLWG